MGEWEGKGNYKTESMTSIVHNMDCMELMQQYPDKHFDLAVVDPPYGIGRDGKPKSTSKHGGHKGFEFKNWDSATPNKHYFAELFRVSSNQIIWGANYFVSYLPSASGWILWDKGQRIDQADGELAFTSFKKPLRIYTLNRVALQSEGTIHPTQKPILLYQWIYKNYLPNGGKVLDTHLGSGSNRIAADKAGNIDFVAAELDKDYFEAQEKRWREYKAQLKLW